jgi:hypothetical protein
MYRVSWSGGAGEEVRSAEKYPACISRTEENTINLKIES